MANETDQIRTGSLSEVSPNVSILKGIQDNLQNSEIQNHLESELRLTLEEIARLQNALAEAEMKLVAYQNQLSLAFSPNAEEMNILSVVSNEINQPITTVLNYCDLLQNPNVGDLTALQKKFINRISNSAKQIRLLSDQLVVNNSADNSHVIAEKISVNIASLFDQMIEPRAKTLEEKQITLQMILSEKIPNISVDQTKLAEILQILLDNALSITPVDSMIKITAHPLNIAHDRFLQLVIKDGGPGVSLKLLDTLFSETEPADQVPAGLALSRAQLKKVNHLVLDLQGNLCLRNGLDFGVIFEINIPLNMA